MTRQDAATHLRLLLDEHKLTDWTIRLSASVQNGAYGLCSYKDKCIILNALHIDTHPDVEVIDTIRHEVAHALTPGHSHDEVWQAKAKELGASSSPCSFMALSEAAIDAIRSGATLEVTFDEQIIRTPKYKVTRLQDKCPKCGKVAVTIKEYVIPSKDETKPDLKLITLECKHVITKSIPKGTPFQTLVSDFKMTQCKGHDFGNTTICRNCGEFKPYSFQVEGMRFIESALAGNKGALVADEMGLGKTIQALGYLKFHPEQSPTLYVVKSSITYQWVKQILVWMGNDFVPQVIKTSKEYLIPGLKSYVISYDMMVFKTKTNKKTGKVTKSGFDIAQFDRVGIKTVVLDECQQIKNPDSSRTQTIRKLVKGRNVIALSGTPWKNRGSEFFSVLNMIAPMKFHSYANYLNVWVEKYWDGNRLKEGGIRNPEKFKEYIKELCIRRERKEVMKELPLINRMKLYIQLDEFQQGEYDGEVSDFVAWYNDKVIGGEEDQISSMNMLARLSRMRHITGLAKIPATIEFAREFIEETDRKLVIFAHHKDVQELLYRQLLEEYGSEIKVMRLTGEQSSQERFQIQEDFNAATRVVMVASTLASGEGLNLQTGADCVIHERQWNPANEEQVEGRFIRIGQTATSVNATYTTAEGTIDDLFDGIVESKRNNFHVAMNTGEGTKWVEGDLIKQLAQALVDRFKKKNPTKEGQKVKSITDMVKI